MFQKVPLLEIGRFNHFEETRTGGWLMSVAVIACDQEKMRTLRDPACQAVTLIRRPKVVPTSAGDYLRYMLMIWQLCALSPSIGGLSLSRRHGQLEDQ
jgi:hypothetical protein